jgi:PPK2 family polyphosphate:nucleotide phosphotransferase
MNIDIFRVTEGSKIKLSDYPADFTDGYTEKDEAKDDLKKNIERLTELQDVLYAQNIYALLIIFQAMDAAGKDSVIEHVMSGVNPQGCEVVSFKAPSEEDRDHDYLWRCQRRLPERGKIGIFNRSHYEEVLVVRVHPEFLAAQQLPNEVKRSKSIWKQRYKQIRNWEEMLYENGVHVIKFFLHVSKEEQRKRFLDRIQESEKNWKFSTQDIKERDRWKDYMKAYRDAIEATSTKESPWYIIPADKKWFTRLAVSEVIVQKLESMNLHYPVMTAEAKRELSEAKQMLTGK